MQAVQTKKVASRRGEMTLGDAVAHFVANTDTQSYKKKGAFTVQRAPIGGLKLSRLSSRAIANWCERRLEQVCLGSVQNDLRIIRLAYEHARRDFGLTLPINPALGVVLNARDRKLSHEELERLCAALHDRPIVRALVIVGALTGLSRGALSSLQWRDIEFDQAVAHLRARSAGPIVRSVPLCGRALAVLQTLDQGTFRVFPITVDRVRWAWMTACRRAGVKGLRFFGARHVLQYEKAAAP